MVTKCTFHRSKPAHFHCHDCDINFCENCISRREYNGYAGKEVNYFCPGCGEPVKRLGLGNVIDPFWNRIGSIFLYPVQPTPLTQTCILSLIGALTPNFLGVFSLAVHAFVWAAMLKYAYATLIITGQGSLRAPIYSSELVSENLSQAFKMIFLFLIIGAATFTIYGLGGSAGLIGAGIFLLFVALSFPAMIMILVTNDSLLGSFNPQTIYLIISRIGWGYFLMYFFMILLYLAPATIIALLPMDLLPGALSSFIELFLNQMYLIIIYHLMGYVLLQYHEEIGYEVDYEYFMKNRGHSVKRKQMSEVEELERGVAVLVKAGKYNKAADLLLPHIKSGNPKTELAEKYLQLLDMAGEKKQAQTYLPYLFDLFVSREEKQKAISLFNKIKTATAAPPTGENIYTLASWHVERRDYKKAIEAYIYFVNRVKKHNLKPEVYFELARLLHEKAGKTNKAKELLLAIIKSHPDTGWSSNAREYLEGLA